MRIFGKPFQPVAHEIQPAAVDVIDADAPLLLVVKQPGGFEYLDVPRCSWPGMFKDMSNLAGGH